MLEKLYKKINRIVTWKSTIVFFFLLIILLLLINGKPFGVAELKERTNGIGILDLERHYTPQHAYDILEAQGEIGRSFYKDILIRLDFIFPLSYTLCWISFIIIIWRRWLSTESKWMKFSLIPIFACLFDYIENIFILVMLNKYPVQHVVIAKIASNMTVLKNIFTGFSIILIIIGLIGLVHKSIVSKRKARI